MNDHNRDTFFRHNEMDSKTKLVMRKKVTSCAVPTLATELIYFMYLPHFDFRAQRSKTRGVSKVIFALQ